MSFSKRGPDSPLTPTGSQNLDGDNVTTLTLPAGGGTDVALISVTGSPVILTMDGTTPTSTNGLAIKETTVPMELRMSQADLAKIQIATTGTSSVNIQFCSAA